TPRCPRARRPRARPRARRPPSWPPILTRQRPSLALAWTVRLLLHLGRARPFPGRMRQQGGRLAGVRSPLASSMVDFSLTRGGLLHAAFRRLGLTRGDRHDVRRQVLALIVVGWVPLVLLAG